MNTLYKITALILITPILFGAVVFCATLILLLGIVGWAYDAETTRPTAQPPKP